ncbi:putative WD repeat-containing protein [Diplonema papillatum]|nr:putative WD repeat-containing protein [Diplonema papillatum]
MEINLDQEYTKEHKQPRILCGGKLSKRAIENLPGFTCHAHVAAIETIFAGRQNGEIVFWKEVSRCKEQRVVNPAVLGQHVGSVTCMLHHPEYPRLLVTGSSDSLLKVWEIVGSGIEGNRCIQTISAHAGTVTDIAGHCDVLLTTSVDKTLKVWKTDEGRAALKYPWFLVKQVFVFDSWTTRVWAFPYKIAEDTTGEVYVGDSSGGLTVLRSVASHQLDSDRVLVEEMELVRPYVRSFRTLAITGILPVPGLNALVTCSFDDCARLSDITTIDTLVNITNKENPGSRFVSMVWSPAYEELFIVDSTGTLLLWNSKADRFIASTHAGHQVSSLSVAEIQGQTCVIATTLESIRLFTVRRSFPYKRHAGHTQRILGVSVFDSVEAREDPSSEERALITASSDNTIRCWGIAAQQNQLHNAKTLREKYSEITAFLHLADDRIAVTGHDNGSLKLWNVHTGKTWRVPGHANTISSLAHGTKRIVAGGAAIEIPHIVSASYDGHLAVWDVDVAGLQPKCELKFSVCRDELLAVAYDPLKAQYITAGNAGVITMWRIVEQKPVKTGSMVCCRTNEYAVTALVLDGNYLFSGGEDAVIRLWDTHSAELLRSFETKGEINALYVVPDTGHLLSCTRLGGVQMWDQTTGTVVSRFDSPTAEELRCLSFCKASGEVFVGTEEGGILRLILSGADGASVGVVPRDQLVVQGQADNEEEHIEEAPGCSQDGAGLLDGNLFSGGEDAVIRLWDTHLRGAAAGLRDERRDQCAVPRPQHGPPPLLHAAGRRADVGPDHPVVSRFDSPTAEELRCLSFCKASGEVFVGTEEGGILRLILSGAEGASVGVVPRDQLVVQGQADKEEEHIEEAPGCSVTPLSPPLSPGSIPEDLSR